MDFNANHHGWETPDALPGHVDRIRADISESSLLRETLSRVEDMARSDNTKSEDRHGYSKKETAEALIISG